MAPSGIEPATFRFVAQYLNSLNSKLNPICHLLTLLGAHRILHVIKIRVNHCATISGTQFHAVWDPINIHQF
jgi:hypothetical protein